MFDIFWTAAKISSKFKEPGRTAFLPEISFSPYFWQISRESIQAYPGKQSIHAVEEENCEQNVWLLTQFIFIASVGFSSSMQNDMDPFEAIDIVLQLRMVTPMCTSANAKLNIIIYM